MPIEIATSEEITEVKRLVIALNSQVEQLSRTFEAHLQGKMPEWLTVKEAANHLRVTPDTIRRKVRAGHFDTRRDGKSILISRDCVLNQSSR